MHATSQDPHNVIVSALLFISMLLFISPPRSDIHVTIYISMRSEIHDRKLMIAHALRISPHQFESKCNQAKEQGTTPVFSSNSLSLSPGQLLGSTGSSGLAKTSTVKVRKARDNSERTEWVERKFCKHPPPPPTRTHADHSSRSDSTTTQPYLPPTSSPSYHARYTSARGQ